MKFRVLLVLLVLGMMATQTLSAHAVNCSNFTIKGTYAFTIHGQIFLDNGAPPLVIDGIAQTTFDGHGNLAQVDAAATNGGMAPGWRPGTGTYAVNSDCTGTMTLNVEGMAPLHLQIVVAQSGNTLHAVVIDPGFAVTSDAERVVASQR
jgi:hypothetical protein